MFVLCLVSSAGAIDGPQRNGRRRRQGRHVGRGLEDKYFRTLNSWVERRGPIEEVQGTVVATCGKLVMLNAGPAERARLSTTDREEFHFRVDVCTKMTVNRVHPQPEFEKRDLVFRICNNAAFEVPRVTGRDGARAVDGRSC